MLEGVILLCRNVGGAEEEDRVHCDDDWNACAAVTVGYQEERLFAPSLLHQADVVPDVSAHLAPL
jgi:hypothetical protein